MFNFLTSKGRWALAAIGILAAISTVWYSVNIITCDQNEEMVLVDQPYFFGNQGIRAEPMKTGRQFFFRSTSGWGVSMVPYSLEVAFDDLSSKDNILLDFKTTITYRVLDSVALVKNFGPDKWFEHNLRSQYSSFVRQAVKSKPMSDIMSDSETSTEIDNLVKQQFTEFVVSRHVPIEVINVTLGRAKPNEQVLQQMNKTAAEQQRLRTLTASTLAEGQRKMEQIAKAEADNAYRNEMKLDTSQFVALQQAKMYSDACEKSEHCIITSGQSTTVIPVK